MKYRPEIDGLRSVAVLPVVLSHAGFSIFSGGFIGVDVFFVISGFLITRILLDEMQDDRFSVVKFYERRARRILPALLVVICACIPFAWYLMMPDFLQNFAQSVVATLLFANNLLLAVTTGYWDLESSFKPLLHTWSLGVEEQYYIVFPIVLLLAWRYARAHIGLMLSLFILGSLIFAEVGWRMFPAENFYLPFGRAWELLVGSLAAFAMPRLPARTRYDDLLSGAGLLAILFAIFGFSETTPSPSLYMAVPVLGSVAIILFCRPETLAHRILSAGPLVFVGLISYSLYLWHQPVFAFARVASLVPVPSWQMGILTLLCVLLSWLTWKYVEQPFRDRRRIPIGRFAAGTGALTSVLVAGGLYLHLKEGLPERIFPNIAEQGDVYISYNERINAYARADFAPGARDRILVIGDSYGRDVANVLLEIDAVEPGGLAYVHISPGDYSRGAIPPNLKHLIDEARIIVVAVPQASVETLIPEYKAMLGGNEAKVIFFGVKHFGYNLNPFARVPMAERPAARARVIAPIVEENDKLRAHYGAAAYVDLIRLLGKDGVTVPVFDAEGRPLSPDRLHLTRYGAIEMGKRLRAERPDVIARLTAKRSNAP